MLFLYLYAKILSKKIFSELLSVSVRIQVCTVTAGGKEISMIIDLKHNKIIESTMTEAFAKSFDSVLVPKLIGKYGDEISFVQMYEDHISDSFALNGEFYYPLTLIKSGEAVTQWIKWKLGKGEFSEKSPYAFLGSALAFELVEKAPDGFAEKLSGRARFSEGGHIKIKIEMMARDMTFLSGRYSQTFVDEMARQLTPAIEKALSVKGISDSSLELCLVFSPESYMEHICENVTYRRLLITDGSGAPKDFWIKWTRLDGAMAYSVSANVNSRNILFEIGEDVSQKIREKEYRFLLNTKGKDKYHNSMGRKNITDWRDIVKRLVKKGELEKIEADTGISKETEELTRQLEGIAGVSKISEGVEVVASKESDEELLKILEYARMKVDGEKVIVDTAEEDEDDNKELAELEQFYNDEPAEDEAPLIVFDDDEDKAVLARQAKSDLLKLRDSEDKISKIEELDSETDETDTVLVKAEPSQLQKDPDIVKSSGKKTDADNPSRSGVIVPIDPCKEEYCENEFSELEDEETLEDETEEEAIRELSKLDGALITETEESKKSIPVSSKPEVVPASSDSKDLEAKIRAEVETKVRLEYEMDARRRAEEETLRLRKENEKLKAQVEAQVRAEAKERERIADAARAEVEERKRREEETARKERMRLEEERRKEAERQSRELEAKRAAEVERITRETEARIRAEYEAKRTAELRAEAERLEREKAERERAEGERINSTMQAEKLEQAVGSSPKEIDAEVNPSYTYITKTVKLLFRRSVDPNIGHRIGDVINATLDYYGKSKVYLKIQASVPDSQTVVLKFVKIPMEEMELLSNIIKILGNSGLGIAKAIIE